VHNGIIENYLELKEELRKEGIAFLSETDSEVIVHLIAKYYTGNVRQAVLQTISRLQGAYAFCVIKKNSGEIIGARNGSPLVVGIGNGEYFFASDVSAIVEHTQQVVYLNDFEVCSLTPERLELCNFQGKLLPAEIKEVHWNREQAQKQGYKHFMLKEIFEQPQVIKESLKVKIEIPINAERIIIIACGTASYAGLAGKYLIEKIAKIPVINEIASEFRYREPLLSSKDLVIAISQSGETADTLAAVRLAKQHGAHTLGIINVTDSTIAREVGSVIYTRAGPEIGVASTKAFTSQLIILYLLAHQLAGKVFDAGDIISKVQETLGLNDCLREIAARYCLAQNMLYIGRNSNFPLALEGALKLKEISYIHAEAYPAGELKHGPIALVSEEVPTIALCPQDDVYEKTISNIQEIKARKGKIIAVGTAGDAKLQHLSDEFIPLPPVDSLLYPLLLTIPLQLLAYHIADMKGCDIDKPRNLAKSVTVE
ncbi:TPA: glutamine--fructose-6-phosphate transaminase (isomerizing), partial [Candidatus Woesearchaeota archaeon]|nr:glutamine--fructose-6-phosphate transaminase (isomerizing) [Candidatus Woesearchaeota archaeon]